MNLREKGRILYISSVDVSIGNGPGVNEREFILGLHAAIGDRAHFLIPRPAKDVAELPVQACTFTFPHHGHNLLRLPFHMLSQIWAAHRILARQKVDLIIFRLDLLPLAPFIITRWHKIPYALKTLGQGVINTLNEKMGVVGKVMAKLNLTLVKSILKKAILADSVSVAQVEFLKQVLNVDPHKIIWVDNAVNTTRFFPSSPEQARGELGLTQFEPIIGYVGTRPWERGGMQLIDSAPQLLKKFPNLGIVILGDGNEVDTMKRKAGDLGVLDRCIFTGYVPFHQVPVYINSLDVGVSISLRPDRFAASELKVRQYLACGKPVILSPGSNDFVIAKKIGSVVQPTDLEAIAHELDRWLSFTVEERREFSRQTAQYMQDNLSIDAAVNRRLDLWSEQLGNGNHRSGGM